MKSDAELVALLLAEARAWRAFDHLGWVDAKRALRAAVQERLDAEGEIMIGFDFRQHLFRQRDFSLNTFGPGLRTKGVLDHIRKELAEIEADPADLSEWIDVVILALDGAWRHGGTPDQIIEALASKQARNEARQWPDWRTADPDAAIEHVRLDAEDGAQ